MNTGQKTVFKVNLLSLFLMAISFISVTLAWFAYSGIANVSTEVNVKAWHIELDQNGKPISHNVVISLSDLYPGMEPMTELIKIRNFGDSDAEVFYKILSARILDDPDDYYNSEETDISSLEVEDQLAHKYPFSINMNLNRNYVIANDEEAYFEISISWPLDSGEDEIDSKWGSKAYNFQRKEILKNENDSDYQILPSIQVVINITAQQFLEVPTVSDPRFNLGDEYLIDVINNNKCEIISETCIIASVIDSNNKLGDDVVNFIPYLYNEYIESTFNNYDSTYNSIIEDWEVNTRPLFNIDIMQIISRDINKSFLIREEVSNQIIGTLNNESRIINRLDKATSKDGHFQFSNDNFILLDSVKCYWTNNEYNETKGFAVSRKDKDTSKLYGNEKEDLCNVIPVITMNKSNLN